MVVGVLTLNIQLPGCKSLKEKRSRLKPLIIRMQRKFNISVAELGQQDAWDSSTIGCALISSDLPFAQKSLLGIVRWLEKSWPDVLLVDDHIEIIT